MRKKNFSVGAVAAVTLLTATAAHAGGLERAGYNIDLLFEPSGYAIETGVTYVNPQRKLNNVRDTNPADGTNAGRPSNAIDATEGYWVPRIGFKAGLGDAVDCMFDYSQPWGAHLNQGRNWVGANENIETKIKSDNYAATCSYSFDAGPGQLRIIGGGFYQELSGFQERLAAELPAFLGTGIGRLDLKGDGWGWRAGVAYEIEEYALRTSLVYNSAVDLDNITGTLNLTGVPSIVNPLNPLLGRTTPVFGAATMPDSLEFKFQTGVAPGWLVFGGVKWTDWSQLQSLPFCPESTRAVACRTRGATEATSLDLFYRDGWTISGGVGHKFNEQWSGALSLTWDRGVSTGLGTHSDTWTLGAGVSYAPTENVEFRVAGALGVLTSGSSGPVVRDGQTFGRASYDFDNDLVSAISTSLKVKF
ncbi:OmpP1/FadL family transporter [Shinella zoogloeoides]|jgi:long-chain fatty acid transport protein|uniref:OmpP1/FadL family transporter n=1 Tax=Shinella zoogloeoides TaxID=352475 RepID=UPI00273D92E4|nr:OmpP1/FadL family transporter [Shinella zoogloeoides]WLR94116.1 OmpP1/FadL family transporter [Shinella zoogloeoides]